MSDQKPSKEALEVAAKVEQLAVDADRIYCLCWTCKSDESCEQYRERRLALAKIALALDAFAADAVRRENEAFAEMVKRAGTGRQAVAWIAKAIAARRQGGKS